MATAEFHFGKALDSLWKDPSLSPERGNFHGMVNGKNYFRRKLALAKSLIGYLNETHFF